MTAAISSFALGLLALVAGGNLLVRGASRLSGVVGVPPLVIGLTVVAFGTSAPEFAVSVRAALGGEPDVAVGNVVGSNIFNLMGVLGLSAAFVPGGVGVTGKVVGFDLPIMAAVAIACLPIFFTEHRIDRWERGLFVATYLGYTVFLILAATVPVASQNFGWIMLAFVVPLALVTIGIGLVRTRRAVSRR